MLSKEAVVCYTDVTDSAHVDRRVGECVQIKEVYSSSSFFFSFFFFVVVSHLINEGSNSGQVSFVAEKKNKSATASYIDSDVTMTDGANSNGKSRAGAHRTSVIGPLTTLNQVIND